MNSFPRQRVLLPVFAAALCVLAVPATGDDMRLGEAKVVFADSRLAGEFLSRSDGFTRRLSPFDRAARMRVDPEGVTEADFLRFAGDHAMSWEPAEKRRLSAAVSVVASFAEKHAFVLPEEILLIKTTGKEEPGSAYTRGNAIIFHPAPLRSPHGLERLLAHELFHLISRKNPKLRDRLYKLIGFTLCGEIPFPESLAPLKITNPDAPVNQHVIRLTIENKERLAVPILVAKSPFEPGEKKTLFQYLALRFLVVKREPDGTWKPQQRSGEPIAVDVTEVKGFFEQIGRNTDYIIHPEEILADNFAFLVTGRKDLPNPELPKKMRKVLEENGR